MIKRILILSLVLVILGPLSVWAQTIDLQYCADFNSLAVYWLENISNQVPSGNPLINHNSVVFNLGNFNNAADFGSNNTNKYLNVGPGVGIGWNGGNVTISLWVKISTEPSNESFRLAQLVDSTTTDTMLELRYADVAGSKTLEFGRTRIGIVSVNFASLQILGTTNWHHVVGTYNGSTGVGTLYLDNVNLGFFTQTGNGNFSVGTGQDNNFILGVFIDGNNLPAGGFLKGLIEEAVVDSTVWDSTKINAVKNRLNPPVGCSAQGTSNLDVPLSTRNAEATQLLIKSKTDNLDVLLSSRASEVTQLQIKSNTDTLIARMPKPWQFYTDSGKGFGMVIDGLILSTINKTDVLLIKNPSASGIITRLKNLYASPDRDFVNIEIYRNPAITSNGTAITPFNHRVSGSLATTQLFQSPVISSRGTLVFSGKLGSFLKIINFELARFLESGENILVVLKADRANIEIDLTLDFAEE